MRSTVCFLTLAGLLAVAGPKNDDANSDVGPLQGGWTMVMCFINGEEVPVEQVKSGALVVDGDEYLPKLGSNTGPATIKVDSSKTPKEIDFTFTAGPQRGKTSKGIYKIAGDELTICRTLTEAEDRPSDFTAPKDAGLLLVVWKRSAAPAPGARKKAIDEELKRFEATWRWVAVDREGEKLAEDLFKDDRLTLKGNQFTQVMGGSTTHGTFKIDPTATPKAIDLTFTDGPGKGSSATGIYELDGDTQKICFPRPGRPRPTEFVSKTGNGQMIQILKREKP
jgi:uncharacterized protein (TIGR03067 family)